MKRALLVSLPVIVLAWVLWPAPYRVKHPTGVEPQRSLQAPVRIVEPPEVDPVDPTEPAARPQELAAAVDAVHATCGLALTLQCEGPACVVVARGPDLDGVVGWLQLVWTSPGFVGTVVARDLGVQRSPCADAIRDLDVGEVRIVESPGGAEVWCAGRGPGHRALCERASGVEGFTGDTRVLRL